MIELRDVRWLAGLLEGEGYFGTINSRVSGHTYRYARIGVSMTDRDVIERVAAMWGTRVHVTTNLPLGRMPLFRACLVGSRAIEWSMMLYGLMGQRRRGQIRKLLAEWRARPTGNEGRQAWSRAAAALRRRDSLGRLVAAG